MRDELTAQRADINARMKGYTAQLLDPALSRLAKDRAEQYQELLKHQREAKAGLTRDQAHGIRRPDLLARDPANPNSILYGPADQGLQGARHRSRRPRPAARADPAAGHRPHTAPIPRPNAAPAPNRATACGIRKARSMPTNIAAQANLVRSLAQRRADRESGGRDGGGRER